MASPSADARIYDSKGGGRFFGDFCNWARFPELEELAFKSPAAAIAARLMRSRTVRLFHDHVLVKEPGADVPTPWHQDAPYYCVKGEKTCSLWIPLDRVPRERAQVVAGEIAALVAPTALAGVGRGLTPDALAGGLRRRVTGESAWMAPAFTQRVREGGASVDQPARPGESVLEGHIRRAVTEDLPALLHYEDRNAMAVSIEARVPFLDHRVVEFLARVPPQLKIREGMTKVLLREAMRGILPESVRRRPDKMGFVMPENDWLRGPWRSAIAETLRSDRLCARPYWRADAMQTLFDRFCERRSGIGPTVWRWVSLEWWMRRMCD